jgi:hypothetical protein
VQLFRIGIIILLTCWACLGQVGLRSPTVIGALSAPSAAVTPASSLVTNCVAFWNLNEESGTRYDLVSTNHLFPTNNPSTVTGVVTNGVFCVSNSLQYFSGLDSPELSTENQTWTLAMWSQCVTTNIGYYTVGKYSSAGQREWFLYRTASSTWSFFVSRDGTNNTSVTSLAWISTERN